MDRIKYSVHPFYGQALSAAPSDTRVSTQPAAHSSQLLMPVFQFPAVSHDGFPGITLMCNTMMSDEEVKLTHGL